jgi:hypothetical protein
MATSYESFVSEVTPFVPGCPDALVISYIRKTVIDLCVRASVYRRDLDPISAQEGTHEYELEAPTGTVIHRIDGVTHLGKPLDAVNGQLLNTRYPSWREESARGTPRVFMQRPEQLIWLVPTPAASASASTIVSAVLKPLRSSKSCADDVMEDYVDTIISGAIANLMRMPGMAWENANLSNAYMGLYLQGVSDAQEHAASEDTAIHRTSKFTDVTGRGTRRRRKRY